MKRKNIVQNLSALAAVLLLSGACTGQDRMQTMQSTPMMDEAGSTDTMHQEVQDSSMAPGSGKKRMMEAKTMETMPPAMKSSEEMTTGDMEEGGAAMRKTGMMPSGTQ